MLDNINLVEMKGEDDLSVLYDFRKDAFLSTFSKPVPYIDKDCFIEKNLKRLQSKTRHYYYIMLFSNVIGALEIEYTSRKYNYGYVKLISIAHDFRCKGYGREALLIAENKFRKIGLSGAILSVGKDNFAALYFYRKNQWTLSDIPPKSASTIMLEKLL